MSFGHIVVSSRLVRPQNRIHITGHILLGQMGREKAPSMSDPGLACLHTYPLTSQFHRLQEVFSVVRLPIINLLPPRRGELLLAGSKEGIMWRANIDKILI